MAEKYPPIHPGEILREEFMVPMKLTAYRIAKDIDVPLPKINDIANEKRGISADTAIRLGHYFSTSAEVWLNLQTQYELDVATDNMKKGWKKQVKVLKEQDKIPA